MANPPPLLTPLSLDAWHSFSGEGQQWRLLLPVDRSAETTSAEPVLPPVSQPAPTLALVDTASQTVSVMPSNVPASPPALVKQSVVSYDIESSENPVPQQMANASIPPAPIPPANREDIEQPSDQKAIFTGILIRDLGPEFEDDFFALWGREDILPERSQPTSQNVLEGTDPLPLGGTTTFIAQAVSQQTVKRTAALFDRTNVLRQQLDMLSEKADALQSDFAHSHTQIATLSKDMLAQRSAAKLAELRARVDELLAETTAESIITLMKLEDEITE